ncbi:MAG TPA: hypothetical protein PKE45_03860 [Caldilineaceae bacterium]|nr:hypothetical protein [Caldilineaceae bacterium]
MNPLPEWSTNLVSFASWPEAALAGVSLLFVLLLVIWWRQQTRYWFRIAAGLALVSLLLCIASYYLFVVPAYYAGCPQGCLGWRGFPRAFASVDLDGRAMITPLDFALNWLMLWLLWLVASVVWAILAVAFRWPERSLRGRLLFVFVVCVLPWAFLPRLIEPPQPTPRGEELRLATNARRSAEFTYRITGFWVHRLAVEDVRQLPAAGEFDIDTVNEVGSQVCLRGYTYFYIPWRIYRIDLNRSGVTALNLTQLPLADSCWQ